MAKKAVEKKSGERIADMAKELHEARIVSAEIARAVSNELRDVLEESRRLLGDCDTKQDIVKVLTAIEQRLDTTRAIVRALSGGRLSATELSSELALASPGDDDGGF